MSGLKLVEIIKSSEDKRHTLLKWVTSRLEEVNAEPVCEDDSSSQTFENVCTDIDAFIRYNAGLSQEEQVDSHYVFLSLSQVYTMCLVRLEKVRSARIFDSAELLAKVLGEDDVGIEVNDTEKKKKKSSKKRSYVRSAAKEMASVMLIHLFETFGQQLASLAPLLFGLIFKNLKKIMEKTKYAHAAFATSLMQLMNSILKNVDGSSFYHEYFPKFTRLSKKVFEAICSDTQEFSIDMVSAIMEIWSQHFRRDSFVKDNKNNLESAILLNYSEGELGSLGFVNDFSRPIIARTLAEVMFHYSKVVKALTIEQVLKIYGDLFHRSVTRDVQSGTFESVVHFFGMCLSTDERFFGGSRYLEIIRSLAGIILCPSRTGDKNLDSLSRNLRYFVHMHKLFLPRLGESSKNLIVFQLLAPSDDVTGTAHEYGITSDPEQLWFNLALLDLAKLLLLELSSSLGNERHLVNQIKKRLVGLSICDNFTLRVHASEVLKLFLFNFPQFLSETIEGSLNALSISFKQDDKFLFTTNHGHALIVANLVACADRDYVSFELIMKITVFATSFIKNHTTTTSTPLYYKGLLSWILLIGCMNYKDDQYLQMQSSQLFLFWKVLLTHNYTSREEDDLYRNLEIRNHALTCLLTFLGNENVGNKTVAKQVSYLLTKCSNFNHSITQKSSQIDKALLINELRLLQIHLRLHRHIKEDFSSSLLILIMKNFSDPNLYSEEKHSLIGSLTSVGDGKRTTNTGQAQDLGEPSVATVLRQNDGFAYGISSKISTTSVSELFIRGHAGYKQTKKFECKEWSWNVAFEDEITRPISCSLSHDYLVTLYSADGYSSSEKYCPRITTALIDASMEIFSLKFPYLNDKIQYSIIETLNSSMFCKTTSPLRNVAIAANTLTALNAALGVMHENDISLEFAVGELLLSSVDKIKFEKDYLLMEMKAESIGLVCGRINSSFDEDENERDMVMDRMNILINGLVQVEEPFIRVLRALSLVSIYKYSPGGSKFGKIFNVILSLISDPHPVAHSWSLKAMHLLIQKHVAMDHATASTLLVRLEEVTTNPSYGMYGSSVLRYNYCMEVDSQLTVGLILKSLTETFGPYIAELPNDISTRFKSLTYGLVISRVLSHQLLALTIFDNVAIFKNQSILNDLVFVKLAKAIVSSGIVPGFPSTCFNHHLIVKSHSFLDSPSSASVMKCFDLFCLLMKLQKGHLFAQDLDVLSWRWLSLMPSSKELQAYLFAWIEQSPGDEIEWFEKLCAVFHMNRERLFFGYYKSCKSISKHLGVENENGGSIPAEEEKSITQAEFVESSKVPASSSDSLSWRAKLLILSMVKHLCASSNSSKTATSLLTRKVPELIRLSFQASTSSVAPLKSLGLDILRLVLRANSYSQTGQSGSSELEQQEAQIVSAIMPAFSSGTPPDVVVSAIDLSAEILASGVSSVSKMDRVSKLLIQNLGVFNESKNSVRLGDVLIVTQKSKKRIELAILSAWAELTQKSVINHDNDLKQFTESYWDVLVPLWIMSLREYAMVKYEGKKADMVTDKQFKESIFEETKLELFEGAWLNMVLALSCVLESNPDIVLQRLNKAETESFMLILFIQCIEIVVGSIDDHKVMSKVLPALHNLLRCCVPLDPLFEDGINEEIVNIMDRIMTMGYIQEKLMVVRITNDLVMRYIKANGTQDSFLRDIDKLYELLRLIIKPISQLLPFIRYNSLEEENSRKNGLNDDEVVLLRECFSALESNVGEFDDLFKVDLYACLLFIIGEIFESDAREEIIPIVLPLLKSISNNIISGNLDKSLMGIFFDAIKRVLFDVVQLPNQLATCFILLTNNFSDFTANDLNVIATLILAGFHNFETQSMTIHGLKSLVNKTTNEKSARFIIKKLILDISESIVREDTTTSNLMIDFVMLFVERVRSMEPKLASTAMAVVLSLITTLPAKEGFSDKDAESRIMSLVAMDKESFKVALNSLLNEKQRSSIEQIMEKSSSFSNGNHSVEKTDLSLKSFV